MRFKEFSGEWVRYKLEDVANIYDGTHQTPNYKKKGIPFVSVEDIKNINVETKFISVEEYNKNFKIHPKKGDILMTRIGDVGTPAIVNFDKEMGYYVSLALLRPFNIKTLFLNYYIQTKVFKKELWIRTIHEAFPIKINKDQIGKCNLKITTQSEQRKIANFLSFIDKRIETQMKIIEEYKSLIQNIKNKIIEKLIFVKWIKIKDICTITTGKLDANAMKENGKYKFFTCSKDDFYIDKYAFDGEALIISGNGELGLIKYYNGKFNAYQRTYVLQNFKLSPIYIKFMMEQYLPRKIYKEKNVGAMPYIVLSTIAELEIPVVDNRIIKKMEQLYLLLNKRQNIDIIQLNHLKKQKQFLLNNIFI